MAPTRHRVPPKVAVDPSAAIRDALDQLNDDIGAAMAQAVTNIEAAERRAITRVATAVQAYENDRALLTEIRGLTRGA